MHSLKRVQSAAFAMLRLEADLSVSPHYFMVVQPILVPKFCSCVFFPHKLSAPREHKGNHRYKQVPCELGSNAVMGLD